jgi:hypothetical protein
MVVGHGLVRVRPKAVGREDLLLGTVDPHRLLLGHAHLPALVDLNPGSRYPGGRRQVAVGRPVDVRVGVEHRQLVVDADERRRVLAGGGVLRQRPRALEDPEVAVGVAHADVRSALVVHEAVEEGALVHRAGEALRQMSVALVNEVSGRRLLVLERADVALVEGGEHLARIVGQLHLRHEVLEQLRIGAVLVLHLVDHRQEVLAVLVEERLSVVAHLAVAGAELSRVGRAPGVQGAPLRMPRRVDVTLVDAFGRLASHEAPSPGLPLGRARVRSLVPRVPGVCPGGSGGILRGARRPLRVDVLLPGRDDLGPYARQLFGRVLAGVALLIDVAPRGAHVLRRVDGILLRPVVAGIGVLDVAVRRLRLGLLHADAPHSRVSSVIHSG